MRIGASRADRLGFTVFVVLAGLLGLLLITSLRGTDESASSGATLSTAGVTGFANLGAAPEVAPTAVPTTAPVAVPEPTETPVPLPTVAPVAAQGLSAFSDTDTDTVDDQDQADGADLDEASVDDAAGNDAAGDDATAGAAGDGASASASTDSAATAVPNPQPQTTAVPNPQPSQPLTTATAVPNPQPGSSAPVDVPAPNPTGGTFTHTLRATVSQPTLYSSPGGSTFMPSFNGTALPPANPTVFGSPLVYRVLAGTPGDAWAQVLVPARPNGTTAWVQTSQFQWGTSNRMIQINVSNNTVTVFEGSNVLLTTQAVTGKSSSRTPIAQGWVEEIIPGPSGAYGPKLLSLGIFSNDLNSFGGGVPKIALHGTNNPSLMGQYASNGCIRVRNEIITQIASMVTPGSKVIITS